MRVAKSPDPPSFRATGSSMSLSTRSRTNSLLQTAGNLTVGDMIGQSSDLPDTALKHYAMPKPLVLSP